MHLYIGVSIGMGVPQNGWLMRENPINMDDDWGYKYPYSRTPPFRDMFFAGSERFPGTSVKFE